jgi:hypothetical protein
MTSETELARLLYFEGSALAEVGCGIFAGDDLLGRIEILGAALLEIAEFEDAGAKLRQPSRFGQGKTTDLLGSLFFAPGLDLSPIVPAIPLAIGPMLHLINTLRLHVETPDSVRRRAVQRVFGDNRA